MRRTPPLIAALLLAMFAALAWRAGARWGIVPGVCLGASLWYVARQLHGNSGALFALALYCFSEFILDATEAPAEMTAAWGFFGALFSAMAIGHTLYAPPGVAERKRALRIAMLACALGVGGVAAGITGTLSPFLLAIPLALGFLVYLVPGRRRAALGAFAIALAGAFIIATPALLNVRPHTGRQWLWRGYQTSTQHLAVHASALALAALLGTALVTYIVWRRSRWFGNTTPVIATAVLLPFFGSRSDATSFIAPLVFLFTGGIFADLLETRRQRVVLVIALSLLVAHAALTFA
jgi:hypothetical protein